MNDYRFIEPGLNVTLVEITGHVHREQIFAALLNQLCYFGRDSEIKLGILVFETRGVFGESDLDDAKRDGNRSAVRWIVTCHFGQTRR